MTTTIPPRFLAGSTEPATAYTVAELRELLAELPGELAIFDDHGRGVVPTVVAVDDGELRGEQILAFWSADDEPDLPFVEYMDLDALAERHDTGGEG